MFIAVPYSLWNLTGSLHDVWLLANSTKNLPADERCVEVKSDAQLVEAVERLGLETVVLRLSQESIWLAHALPRRVKVILWAHNFVRRDELSKLAKDNRVACIVCVGNEQLQMYRDHQAYYKSVVIPNGYPVEHFLSTQVGALVPFAQRTHEVTYLGSLVDFKGFHLLAKAWKQVVTAVPDAHLNVIGGGKLYDRSQRLGRWGLAEESYEQQFIPYLLDEDGKILPSVTFHGVMGNEKAEVLRQTKVGVPNPSGISETFCIAALELQLYGAVVTTIRFGGFKDTVFSTGILYENPDELADCVIRQLLTAENNYEGFAAFAAQFEFKKIAERWTLLFDSMAANRSLNKLLKPAVTSEHRGKEFNRKLKSFLPFGKWLPSTMFYHSLLWRLKAAIPRG